MLRRRTIKKLRVAACTALERSRLGGVLDLMEARFPVREYWLPEDIRTLTAAALNYDGDWQAWRELTGGPDGVVPAHTAMSPFPANDRQWWECGAAALMVLTLEACGEPCGHLFHHIHANETAGVFNGLLAMLAKRIARRWRNGATKHPPMTAMAHLSAIDGSGYGPACLCGRLLLNEATILSGGRQQEVKGVVTTLALTAMTAVLVARNRDRVRFMKQSRDLTDNLVSGHPVKSLNGEVADQTPDHDRPVTPASLLGMARRFGDYRRSLVYQYGDFGCSVLLCGDSRFEFLNRHRSYDLDRPTVVIAPRQGTCSADRAYPLITSSFPDRDIWVRTITSKRRRISDYFREKPTACCLEDENHAVQEILLQHDGSDWRHLSGCLCRD